jgi:O-antigen/teichoic acid export membrane protein
MALAVGGIARSVGDFGVSAIVVQRDSLESDFLSAAFSLNLFTFLLMAAAQIAIAPLGSWLMGEPRLTLVMIGLAVAIPFTGVGGFYQALMKRELDFSALVHLGIVSVAVTSVVACTLAFLGAGVWSLVLAQISSAIVLAVIAYRKIGKWIPVSVSASLQHAREIGRFGKYATGNSIISYILYNADYLLIGRMLPTAQLGFYFFAYEKSRLVSVRLLNLVASVSFPAFSRIQNDTQRLLDSYRSITVTGFALIAPISVFLAVHAGVVIPFLFGHQWNDSILVFQILSIAVLINAMSSGVGSVVYAIGRPEIIFNVNRWIVVPLIAAYVLGAHFGGIVGVAVAVVIAKGSASIIKLMVTYRRIQWDAWPIVKPLLGVLAGAFASGIVSTLVYDSLDSFPMWAALILASFAYCAAFLVSQPLVNREGLGIFWRHILGDKSMRVCQRFIPQYVLRTFEFPLGG